MYTRSEIRERRVHPVRTARWQSKIHAGRERDARSEFAREIEHAVQEIATPAPTPAGGSRPTRRGAEDNGLSPSDKEPTGYELEIKSRDE